jgi:hypothetical protein
MCHHREEKQQQLKQQQLRTVQRLLISTDPQRQLQHVLLPRSTLHDRFSLSLLLRSRGLPRIRMAMHQRLTLELERRVHPRLLITQLHTTAP